MSVDLTTGLIGRWMLNSGYGMSDLGTGNNSGTGSGGITIGGATDHKGIASGATYFVTDDYIRLSGSYASALNVTGSGLTVSYWMYPSGTPANYYGAYMKSSDIGTRGYSTAYITGNKFSFGIATSGVYSGVPTSGTYAPNNWYHVSNTYDGTKMIVYVNGAIGGSGDKTGNINSNTSKDASIGCYLLDATQNIFATSALNGKMEDVRVYDRALNQDEVIALYQRWNLNNPAASIGISDLQKGLIGHWKLDGVKGAKDLTPNEHHGVGYSGVTIGGATDVKGESSGATTFNGSSNYVDFGNSTSFNFGALFSLSIWFKPLVAGSAGGLISKGRYAGGWDLWQGGISVDLRSAGFNIVDHSASGAVQGAWNHLAITYDDALATNGLNIYINGTKTSFNATGVMNTSTNNLVLGKYVDSDVQWWEGDMCDFRVYNRALSQPEVALLYNSYKPATVVLADFPNINGLLAWWKVDSLTPVADGTQVAGLADQSVNANHFYTSVGGHGALPLYYNNVQNGKPALRFNSTGTTCLAMTNALSTIRTVFWVVSRNAAGTGYMSLFGLTTDTDHFLGDGPTCLWDAYYTSPYVKNGTTKFNGTTINGLVVPAPTTPTIISLVSTGSLPAVRFSRPSGYQRSWKGDMFEIIVYDRALTADEVHKVEQYLSQKYKINVK